MSVIKVDYGEIGGSKATLTYKNGWAHSTTNPTEMDFSQEVTISKLVLYFKVHAASGFSFGCAIQTSPDGTNWTTIETTPVITVDTTYTVTTPITAQYVRFLGSGGQAPQYCHVNGYEIEY